MYPQYYIYVHKFHIVIFCQSIITKYYFNKLYKINRITKNAKVTK